MQWSSFSFKAEVYFQLNSCFHLIPMTKPSVHLLILSLILIVGCKSSMQTASSKRFRPGEGSEENLSARKKWELERLADPRTGRIPRGIRQKELAFAATIPGHGAQARLNSQMVPWELRGPTNLGGRTRAFAMDVTNENVLFAGGVSGGLWRSTDAGLTWNRVTDLNGYQGVIAIAQDKRPGHTDTWYYLTGEAYGTSASGGGAFYLGNGVYKSTDGGLTWNSLPSTVSGTPQSFDNVWDVAWNMVTDVSNPAEEEVYVATYDAIYRSVNGGTSWSRVRGYGGTTAASAYFTDVAVSPSGVVYATLSSDGATNQKGIWRSNDGITWTNITPSNFPSVYDRLVIEIDPNNENRVYFFGPTPGFGRVSTDFLGDTLYNSLWRLEYDTAGSVWTDLSQNMPGNIGVFNGLNTQGGYDVVVKVKPGDPNTVFIGGTNIYRSTSAFADSLNTTVMGGYAIGAALPFVGEYPGHHPDQHVLAFLPSNPDVMYSAHDGGVSRTEDNMAANVVWGDRSSGYVTSQFYTVTMDMNSTSDVLLGGLQDNGTWYTNSTDPAVPWYPSFDGDGSYSAIANNGANYYFSKQQGRIYKTTIDAQGAVTAYRRMDPIGASNYRFIAPFLLDPNDNNIMYLCAGESIWRNDDLSAIALTGQFDTISTNWVQFPDTLVTVDEVITALAISTVPAHRLYYGTNKRNVYRVDSVNTGLPPRVLISNNQFPFGYVSCIAVNPQNADELLVVFSNYNVYSLFHTDNAGASWNRVAGNLEVNSTGSGSGPSLRWASILPLQNGDKVYLVGASTGLYATATLNGLSTVWYQQGYSSIGTSVVDMVVSRPADGRVAVGTHGNGMFGTTVTSTGDITGLDENGPFATLKVFPNPASREITVSLGNGFSQGQVRCSVMDELGRLVDQFNSVPTAGFALNYSTQKLASGTYYFLVEQGERRGMVSFLRR